MPIDPGGPNDSHYDRFGVQQPGLNVQARVGPGVFADEPLDRKELRKKTQQLNEFEQELHDRAEALREKEEAFASLSGTK